MCIFTYIIEVQAGTVTYITVQTDCLPVWITPGIPLIMAIYTLIMNYYKILQYLVLYCRNQSARIYTHR